MKIFLAGAETRHGMLAEIIGGGGNVFIQHGDREAMKVFLAGAVAGNLNPYWIRVSRRIENGQDYKKATEEEMRLFLAGVWPWKSEGIYDKEVGDNRPYILESFFYADKDTERLLPYFGDFLLDSGAFTFCGTGGFNAKQFDNYIELYADFINRNGIEKFFELDVDSITGYEKVKEYRKRLEKLTGRQPIPVWHINRGKEEFIRHCDEYPYVALGGYVAAIKASDSRNKAYIKAYPWFISEAHKRGKKIHGLGFTRLNDLEKYHFDSVDSTSWTTGNRFGYLYFFNGKTMIKKDTPAGHRIGNSRAAAVHNFTEWIKFQKYADKHF